MEKSQIRANTNDLITAFISSGKKITVCPARKAAKFSRITRRK